MSDEVENMEAQKIPQPHRWNIGRVRDSVPALGASHSPVSVGVPGVGLSGSPVVGSAMVERVPASTPAWCESASVVVTGVAVALVVDVVRAPDSKSPAGYTVDEPDEDDVERCEEAVAKEMARRFGPVELPWWAGLGVAFGGLYLGVRRARKPIPVPVGTVIEASEVSSAPKPPTIARRGSDE